MFNPLMLLRGCALGLGAAIPIGPVNVEIARRTLRGGFRDGFLLGCGAVTIDVMYAVIVSIAVPKAMGLGAVQKTVGPIGAAMLIYLGVMSLRAAAKPQSPVEPAGKNVGGARNYLTGLLLTSLNPMTLVFWFTAVPGVAGALTADPRRDLPIVCCGVFLAAIAWVCIFAGTLHAVGSMGRKDWWMRAADIGGGVILLLIAAAMLWKLGDGFLS